jgi:hypothetical protein
MFCLLGRKRKSRGCIEYSRLPMIGSLGGGANPERATANGRGMILSAESKAMRHTRRAAHKEARAGSPRERAGIVVDSSVGHGNAKDALKPPRT